MQLTELKNFKMRYFVLFSIVIMVVSFFISLFFQDELGSSEWLTFFISLALLGYVLVQTKKLAITYSEENVKTVMTGRRWTKYLTVTALIQISAVAIGMFVLSFVYLKFEDVIRDFFYAFLMEDVRLDTPLIDYVLFFLNACILAPLWEELFFRGVLLRRFMIKWSPQKSIIVSSIIFSLIHINPLNIVFTFCIGCLLSYAYIKTKSIIVPMVMHSFSNFLAFIQFCYANQATTELLPKTDSVRLEMIVSGSIVVLFSIILIIIILKNFKHFRGLTYKTENADLPLE